jgi:hypothetical protein
VGLNGVERNFLTARALNRALLARQGLLERSATPAATMIERLVGMQAQVPSNPYVALWSRLSGFETAELSDLIAQRRAVRAQLMRSTIHLVSARDCLALHPLTQPVLARVFNSPFGKQLGSAALPDVVAAGRELLAEAPRTRAELAELLAPRWPDAQPTALAHAVTFNLPLVQAPPRGQWRTGHRATWALAEDFLDARLDPEPSASDLVLRYLAAFGPASPADVRTWCAITGLRAVIDELRPRLRTFRDPNGRELLDVEDGLFVDPETPAPPRFLPEFDNALLSHADRSRVIDDRNPGLPYPSGAWIGQLLVDGFVRAYWKLEDETLTIDRFTPHPGDPPGTAEAIEAEGERLVAFITAA